MDISAREYFAELAAEHGVSLVDERQLLWDYLRSTGFERGFVAYARTELATRPQRAPRGGGYHSPHPESFPPGWQER